MLRECMFESEGEELERVQMRLALVGFTIKKIKTARSKRIVKRWEEDLSEAWQMQNVSKSWRVTKRMARGKKRRYALVTKPLSSEWSAFLGKPGPDGGLQATVKF